jgi:hypothetical protein
MAGVLEPAQFIRIVTDDLALGQTVDHAIADALAARESLSRQANTMSSSTPSNGG